MIRIHNFSRGARGLRATWLCEEMGLDWEPANFAFPPPPEYLKLNPLGSVPFLEDDRGASINESVAMLFYIAGAYGPTDLLPPPSDPAYARVVQMTVFGEATLGAVLNPLMMERFGAPDDAKGGWLAGALNGRLGEVLAYIEGILGAGPYLAGQRFSLADISVGCGLGMAVGALGVELSPVLAAYRARLMDREAYQRAAERSQG